LLVSLILFGVRSDLCKVETLLALARVGVAVAGIRLHPVGGAVALLAGAPRHLRVTVVVVRTDVTPLAWVEGGHSFIVTVNPLATVFALIFLIDFKLCNLIVEENFSMS
jgi:hypothetical protein